MSGQTKIRDYKFNDQIVGTLIEEDSFRYNPVTGNNNKIRVRRLETELSEFAVIDMVEDLTPAERVHLKIDAYPLFRLLEHYEINPDDYVSDEDVLIHIANRRYKSLTELNRQDHRAWELVKQRGLGKQLFIENLTK